MALGMIVILGAIHWHQILKKTLMIQKEKRRDLHAGRTVFQFFMNDLENSGYRGCRTLDDNFPVHRLFVNFASPMCFFRMDRKVFGFHATSGNCLNKMPKKVCKRVKENSDVLVIYNIPQAIHFLKRNMKRTNEVLYVEGEHHIRRGSVVLISDCLQGELFIAEETEAGSIFHRKTIQTNFTDSFSKLYQKGAEITELQTVAYYLGVTVREGRLGTYSLYRDDLLHEAEEILDKIVDFQVRFGVLVSPDVFQYKDVSEIRDDQWSMIKTVYVRVKVANPLERDKKLQDSKGSTSNVQDNKAWVYEFSI